jgi:CRISPR-associated endonuclease/helicase Cas3
MNYKILVVCNSIKKTRFIYDLLIDKVCSDNILLYHSQFILIDKIYKENILYHIHDKKSGFIAICTQIVEVSLDIDFDVLYTENAPIDAIIQRLGRVNRKGNIKQKIPNMDYAKVIITKESEESRKYIYKDLSKILTETYLQLKLFSERENGNLNETDLKNIVENVYTKENLNESFYQSINEGRKLIRTLWNDYLNKIYTLNIDETKLIDISSRKNDFITVESVLIKHYQELNFDELIENKNFDLLKKYTIKVPIYLAKKYKIKKLNNSDIYLLDIKYDSCQGISIEPEELNFI